MVKPILFNTEMVRSILDGRKTVTRRVVKCSHRDAAGFNIVKNGNGEIVGVMDYDDDEKSYDDYTIPPYLSGDILYVRETWNYGYFDSSDAELDNSLWFEPLPLDYKRNSYIGSVAGFVYRADFIRPEEYEYGTLDENNVPKPIPWRPSIYMPREAARIFLRVKDVRVEQLQEMRIDDVLREGAPIANGFEDFMRLWDATIKPVDRDRYGWAANPFCWVIEFERCEKPEEA